LLFEAEFRGVSWGKGLELHFYTAELRQICAERDVATKKFGYAVARRLAERLADIDAADTADELCELLGNDVYSNGQHEKCIRLGPKSVLVFRSAHPGDVENDSPTNWTVTTRMMILSIGPVDD
jgi:hypothetical protein